MYVTIYPNPLHGEVIIPPSKSLTHRALICASLVKGKSIIYNPLYSDDTNATISCLKNLGVTITKLSDRIIVEGEGRYKLLGKLDGKESASTIRFLIPLVSHFVSDFSFHGSKRLTERLNTKDLLNLKGLKFDFFSDHVRVSGKLEDEINLSDSITSQFISGIIFLKPIKKININVPKNPYIDLTQSVVNYFLDHGKYVPREIIIESDFSSASFFIAMMLFNNIKIKGLNFDSLQGDKKIITFLEKMDAKFSNSNNRLLCLSGETKGIDLDLTLYPDLVPIMAAIASVSKGQTTIVGIEKLKYKESDRIKAIYLGLKQLGADIKYNKHNLIINGQDYLEGCATVDGFSDHRIIMSLVAISSKVKNPYTIKGFSEVNKSFPNFWDLYKSLGGKYECKVSN
ncbi:MAG TPA: hypothetical protein GXZ48_02195 [Acholeplasmataceae bacterium]|nr:hypothetical protein [Acholeplasmataceae bacterium]